MVFKGILMHTKVSKQQEEEELSLDTQTAWL